MSVFPGPSNPIVYAQFILQGRWRRLLMVVGIYGLLLVTAIWITTSVVDVYSRARLIDWVRGLMALQFVSLGLGALGVEVGVRRDISTRMIESNRLMPAPPLGSVLGYVFGAPLFAYGLVLMNFLLGATCCQLGGFAFGDWVIANALVILCALVIYCLITQFAFIIPGTSVLLMFGTGVALGSTSNGANLLPSVSVLLFPLLARSSPVVQLFTGTTSTVDGGAGYVLAIGGLLLIAAIAIRIAVRRYQAVGAVGISPALGLMFLAVWAVLAAADCAMPDVFNFDRYLRYSGEELTAQIVCALSSTMLIALLPIAGAALMVQRRQTTWAANFWVPLASMIVVCCVLAGVRGDNLPRSKVPSAVVQSCIVIAAFALTTTCFFSAGYRHRRRAWVYVLFWITITWLTPVIVDAVHRSANGDINNTATVITSFSPPGALAMIWNGSRVQIGKGLVGQIAMAAIPGGLLVYAVSRKHPDAPRS